MKTAKDGSSTTAIVLNQDRPFDIAVDATDAYWTNQSGTVMKVGLNGGAPVMLATGQNKPSRIVVGGGVYWINQGSNNNDGEVMRLPK